MKYGRHKDLQKEYRELQIFTYGGYFVLSIFLIVTVTNLIFVLKAVLA